MYKRILQWALFMFCAAFLSNGCATLFKGYEDKVDLIMADDSLRVYTIDGAELEIKTEQKRFVFFNTQNKESKVDTTTNYFINLRTNDTQTLVLQKGNKKKIIETYPKIGSGWFLLDILTGGLPAIIDMYTGNWNYFENITVEF
jgi:hypothetical protein